MSISTDNEVANTGEIATFMEEENLKNIAKRLWLFGEWEELSQISINNTPNNDETAIVSLLISSALLQLNKADLAERYLSHAINCGINKKLASKILIASAHNSLGRISCLQAKSDAAKNHFYKAVDIGTNNPELIAQSRAVKEMCRMGLLPQAFDFIREDLVRIESTPSQIKNINAQIKTLRTEIDLLKHELSLSQQKLQLYQIKNEIASEDLTTGSSDHVEKLKQLSPSQLGQDLWVLEKTNYKKGGFFVEFGATDGVLLSNSYLLERQFGWTGICAEPNPKFYEKLKKNRSCTVSECCIAGESGKIVDFIFADEFGCIMEHAESDFHADKRLAFQQINSTAKLTTISLDDFLKKYNAPKIIDYLSIDTEGSEYEILFSFPFQNWDIGLISVEHNYTPMRDQIFELLTSKGYLRVESMWDDWYFKNNNPT